MPSSTSWQGHKKKHNSLTGAVFLYLQAYNNRKDNYQDVDAMKLVFEKLDPVELMKEMAAELEKMLESKMVALNVSTLQAFKRALLFPTLFYGAPTFPYFFLKMSSTVLLSLLFSPKCLKLPESIIFFLVRFLCMDFVKSDQLNLRSQDAKEANWSGSTLFAKAGWGYIQVQQDKGYDTSLCSKVDFVNF